MSSSKHGWASVQTYLNAHHRVLKTYQTWMDRAYAYKLNFPTSDYMELECEGMIFTTYKGTKVRVDIKKDAELDRSNPKRVQARTCGYSYNAYELRSGDLIRYDAPDPEAMITSATPEHHRFHHKHIRLNGKETITRVPDGDWPHVDEFFREVLSAF